MISDTAIPRVEHETGLAALAAAPDHPATAAATVWRAGGTAGMSDEAAAARDQMTEVHADPTATAATAADAADADEAFHAACLGQAADLMRSREAATKSIQSIMLMIRGAVETTEDVTTEREQVVDAVTRRHAGVIHTAVLATRLHQRAGHCRTTIRQLTLRYR